MHCTRTEFRLLCELAASPNKVLSREQLLDRVWGYDYFGDGRLVDVHITAPADQGRGRPGAASAHSHREGHGLQAGALGGHRRPHHGHLRAGGPPPLLQHGRACRTSPPGTSCWPSGSRRPRTRPSPTPSSCRSTLASPTNNQNTPPCWPPSTARRTPNSILVHHSETPLPVLALPQRVLHPRRAAELTSSTGDAGHPDLHLESRRATNPRSSSACPFPRSTPPTSRCSRSPTSATPCGCSDSPWS